MDYELAKKLRDAGFTGHMCFETEYGCIQSIEGPNYSHACLPTLSELIEACPREIEGNVFCLIAVKDRWECYYDNYGPSPGQVRTEGSTPEEAAARLWLALNKK